MRPVTEAAAWRLVTGVLFAIAATIGAITIGPVAVEIVFGVWLMWLTVTAATREQVTLLRRRTMHAIGTLRRRHDDELLEVWVATMEKPAAEYAPEPGWASTELAQPDVFVADLEPATDEIPVAPPTVPDAMPLAVQSALIAPEDVGEDWEQWIDRKHRDALAALDRIGGAA